LTCNTKGRIDNQALKGNWVIRKEWHKVAEAGRGKKSKAAHRHKEKVDQKMCSHQRRAEAGKKLQQIREKEGNTWGEGSPKANQKTNFAEQGDILQTLKGT